MPASVIEFYNVLVCTSQVETPIFLVLNKVDSLNAMDCDRINELFNLTALMKYRKNLEVRMCSAMTGGNVQNLMDSTVAILDVVNPQKKKNCCF